MEKLETLTSISSLDNAIFERLYAFCYLGDYTPTSLAYEIDPSQDKIRDWDIEGLMSYASWVDSEVKSMVCAWLYKNESCFQDLVGNEYQYDLPNLSLKSFQKNVLIKPLNFGFEYLVRGFVQA